MSDNKKKAQKYFGEEAKNAAKTICGCGKCFGNYECGHANNTGNMLPKITKDDVCPLAKYNVEPDTRTFKERLEAGEAYRLEERDLFAICACCDHTDGIKEVENDCVELNRTDKCYEKHCMDCPVNMAYENMLECMAEAAAQ